VACAPLPGQVVDRTFHSHSLMCHNVNTQAYWDQRFASGSWERNRGRQQTADFALGQIPYLCIPADFAGTLLDFGCGLGDAFPIYRHHYPRATLIGMDLSASAIALCRREYSGIATFLQGDHTAVPKSDIIIASNVFEHLSDDRQVAEILLTACVSLKVIVPYKEYPLTYKPPPGSEHVNIRYDEQYFQQLDPYETTVFPCRGWSEYGFKLWYHIFFWNILRRMLALPLRPRKMQILFHLGQPTGVTKSNACDKKTTGCAVIPTSGRQMSALGGNGPGATAPPVPSSPTSSPFLPG